MRVVNDNVHCAFASTSFIVHGPFGIYIVKAHMASKRILIVDDEPNIGLSLQMILEGEGYSAVICRTAAEFRSRAITARADVCLLDVRLPDGNGIDLLRLLRENDDRVPVVMISGHGT